MFPFVSLVKVILSGLVPVPVVVTVPVNVTDAGLPTPGMVTPGTIPGTRTISIMAIKAIAKIIPIPTFLAV